MASCGKKIKIDFSSPRLTIQKREISLPVTDYKPRDNKRLGIVGCDVIPGVIPTMDCFAEIGTRLKVRIISTFHKRYVRIFEDGVYQLR